MAKDALRFLGDSDNSLKCACNILDKEGAIFHYVQYMFDRTNSMFKYSNLPDTIPEPIFEYMIQIYGSVAVARIGADLYAFRCNFGGPPDPYYRPTQAVVANPALNISDTFRIVNHLPPFDKERWSAMPPCVRVLNDSQIQGLFPMFVRYATQLAENDVSIRSAQINLRQQTVIAASDGPEIESATQYLKNLEDGVLSAIAKKPFLEGITIMDSKSGGFNVVTQLVELQQYLRASWYNEIGLNSNFNMKREYLSTAELGTSEDMMLPLVDNMLSSRQSAVEAINKEFGTSITVEKNSAWGRLEEIMEAEAKELETSTQEGSDESTAETEEDSEERDKEETKEGEEDEEDSPS